jgi:hypothetical protein
MIATPKGGRHIRRPPDGKRGPDYLLAQPPLPLQEFLPEQPLSPALQLPCPLQEFLPLQSCFAEDVFLD